MIKTIKGIFYYSGFEYIYRKAKPVTGLPTLPLWLIGIYIAFFGIASQRYENRVDIIENRANSIFTQLGTSSRKSALSRIASVQNYPCPVKPMILNPVSVFKSTFTKDVVYPEMVKLLQETIEDWKKELEGVDLFEAHLVWAKLRGANLTGADLEGANLEGADLSEANLEGASLKGANLSEAQLLKTNLKRANLEGANLRRADLSKADLSGANLDGARLFEVYLSEANLEGASIKSVNLKGADLQGANLRRADLRYSFLTGANLWLAYLDGANLLEVFDITIGQLFKVNTLYKAQFDSGIMEVLRRDIPQLFEEPKEKYSIPDE